MGKKITSGKIRWALNIILIVLWAAIFCIVFIKGVTQSMVSWWGPSAYEIYPTLLACVAILSAVRLYCVESKTERNHEVSPCRDHFSGMKWHVHPEDGESEQAEKYRRWKKAVRMGLNNP